MGKGYGAILASGEMNYKRKKPANRKIRRTNGRIGLGKDQIRQVVDKDWQDRMKEAVKNQD